MCEACNATLPKRQLAGHGCVARGGGVSCVDCNASFSGGAAAGHTTCVSEAERYGADKFVSKRVAEQKARQAAVTEAWAAAVREVVEAEPRGSETRALLERLVGSVGEAKIPSNEKKFANFVRSSAPRTREATVADAWAKLEAKKRTALATVPGKSWPQHVVANVLAKWARRARGDDEECATLLSAIVDKVCDGRTDAVPKDCGKGSFKSVVAKKAGVVVGDGIPEKVWMALERENALPTREAIAAKALELVKESAGQGGGGVTLKHVAEALGASKKRVRLALLAEESSAKVSLVAGEDGKRRVALA